MPKRKRCETVVEVTESSEKCNVVSDLPPMPEFQLTCDPKQLTCSNDVLFPTPDAKRRRKKKAHSNFHPSSENSLPVPLAASLSDHTTTTTTTDSHDQTTTDSVASTTNNTNNAISSHDPSSTSIMFTHPPPLSTSSSSIETGQSSISQVTIPLLPSTPLTTSIQISTTEEDSNEYNHSTACPIITPSKEERRRARPTKSSLKRRIGGESSKSQTTYHSSRRRIRRTRVDFGSVKVHRFEQRCGGLSSAVPDCGKINLHLGRVVGSPVVKHIDEWEGIRQSEGRKSKNDYTPLEDCARRKRVKQFSVSDLNRTKLKRELDDLNEVRMSRECGNGCRCKILTKMTKSEMIEQLRLRGLIPDEMNDTLEDFLNRRIRNHPSIEEKKCDSSSDIDGRKDSNTNHTNSVVVLQHSDEDAKQQCNSDQTGSMSSSTFKKNSSSDSNQSSDQQQAMSDACESSVSGIKDISISVAQSDGGIKKGVSTKKKKRKQKWLRKDYLMLLRESNMKLYGHPDACCMDPNWCICVREAIPCQIDASKAHCNCGRSRISNHCSNPFGSNISHDPTPPPDLFSATKNWNDSYADQNATSSESDSNHEMPPILPRISEFDDCSVNSSQPSPRIDRQIDFDCVVRPPLVPD